MLDPKRVRTQTEEIARRLTIKNFEFDTATFEQLEERRRALQVSTENLQSEQNKRSKSIGKAKAAGEDIQPPLVLMDVRGRVRRVLDAVVDAVPPQDEPEWAYCVSQLQEATSSRLTTIGGMSP